MTLNPSLTQLASSRRLERGGRSQSPVRGDALALPFRDRAFDRVYALNSFYHFERPGAAIAEIRRLLEPGGLLGLDDWFLTAATREESAERLRRTWSRRGFHRLDEVRRELERQRLEPIEELDCSAEAAAFLTEERFGAIFDRQVRARIVAAFPRLYAYDGYRPEHAELAARQLRDDILHLGRLYRSGEAVYRQVVARRSD